MTQHVNKLYVRMSYICVVKRTKMNIVDSSIKMFENNARRKVGQSAVEKIL